MIDKDFIIKSDVEDDLTSAKIVKILEPALNYYSKNSNPIKRKEILEKYNEQASKRKTKR